MVNCLNKKENVYTVQMNSKARVIDASVHTIALSDKLCISSSHLSTTKSDGFMYRIYSVFDL